MMKKIFQISFYVLLANILLAQSDNGATQMVVRAQADYDAINITWYPTDSEDWDRLQKTGYSVERQELDGDGNTKGNPSMIASNVILQSNEWFLSNQEAEGVPLLKPVRALIYDDEFDFDTRNGLDKTQMRYNFIASEAINDPIIAYATGLGATDNDPVSERSYRYTVKAKDGSISGYVDIGAYLFTLSQNPEESPIEFQFPNDLSLSDMYNQGTAKRNEKVIGLSRAYGDSIVVRWVPANSAMWYETQDAGFEIYRSKGIEEVELVGKVNQWTAEAIDAEYLKATDSSAFIAAGMLYGSFDESNTAGMDDRLSLQNNYFAMAVISSERSALAADILGFRFVDKDVDPDEEYTYIISSSALKSNQNIGMVNVTNTYEPVEAPSGCYTEPGDSGIKIKWPKSLNRTRFSYYKVERSSGKNFEKLNGSPIVFFDTDEMKFTEYFFEDTTAVNGQKYTYRLYGGNSFGEWSEPAVVEGSSKDMTPPAAAFNVRAAYADSLDQILISWEQDVSIADDIAFSQVMLSQDESGEFSAISEKLDKEDRSFILNIKDLGFENHYYFVVANQDKDWNRSHSSSALTFVPDMTAPEVPEDINGTIDSLGRVDIWWTASEARDTRGYWLYWASSPDDEMSLVTKDIITDDNYHWYIETKSLNEKIYFCLRAQDHDFNRSNPSPILEVQRPDNVPPITPLTEAVLVGDNSLTFTWSASPSEDVDHYLVFKRDMKPEIGTWEFVDTVHFGMTFYDDYKIGIDTPYEYSVQAVDDADNKSGFSTSKKGIMPFPSSQNVVEAVEIKVNGDEENQLSWMYNPSEVVDQDLRFTYEIYRSTGTGGLDLLATVESTQTDYIDKELYKNVLYTYAVRVKYKNGWVGDMGEQRSIIIQ